MEKTIIFILHPEEHLAQNLAQQFPNQIADCSMSKFKDGEIHFENHTSVRNKKCFIIQSIGDNVNDSVLEVLIAIDALKRASAMEINVVMPYLPYARQDRKALPRQPISARLLADLLEVAGANRIVTFDLHTPQIEGFYSIPVDNIPCGPLFINFLKKKQIINKDTIVVSPDHGSAVRARKLAELLGVPLAIIDKRRENPNEVYSMDIIGNVLNKNCLIVDDLIDTGNTLCKSAEVLKENGATSVYACCTHGVLSNSATERITKSQIDGFFVTNSIEKVYHLPENQILDLSEYLAIIIKCLVDGDAVTEIYKKIDL